MDTRAEDLSQLLAAVLKIKTEGGMVFPVAEGEFFERLFEICPNATKLPKQTLMFALEGLLVFGNAQVDRISPAAYDQLICTYFRGGDQSE